jgi:hypothetical protein
MKASGSFKLKVSILPDGQLTPTNIQVCQENNKIQTIPVINQP